MSISIRPATFSKNNPQTAIKEINASVGWEDSIQGYGFEAYLETTKKVVGYVHLSKSECLFIDHLAVHKNHQGKGIGKILLKETFAIAQQERFSTVKLISTSQKSNEFYTRCATKLRLNYQALESGSFEDPEGTKYFTFFLDENTPPFQRVPPAPTKFFFGYFTF